jgi:hypothetical protein
MNGWFKAPRRIVHEDFFGNAKAVQLYFYLAAMASIKQREVTINGHTITLNPGEIAIGRKVIAMACNMAESTVENLLKKLTKNKIIGQKTFPKYRLISILCEDCEQEDGHIFGQITDASLTQVGRKLDTSSDASLTQVGHYIRKKKEDSKERKKKKEEVTTPQTPQGGLGHSGEVLEVEPVATQIEPKKKAGPDPEFIEAYQAFCKKHDILFRFEPADAAAIKSIHKHFSQVESVKTGAKQPIELWQFFLDNWSRLDPWQQRQVQLRQINTQLPSMIQTIKQAYNGQSTNPNTNSNYEGNKRLVEQLREKLENFPGF